MLASNLGVAGVLPTIGGVLPGTIAPGIASSGIYPGVGTIGAPVVGASGVYGAPIATTNQFYTQGYNEGLFGCNSCPWWLWLILFILVIGGFVASLASWFGGS